MHINYSSLKAIWSLLTKEAWLCVLVICLALTISLQPETPEHVIRITGLFLQLFGILTVIWGISETRALFGLPSFASKIKTLLRRNIVVGVGSVDLSLGTGRVRARVIYGAGENPTPEARIEALEKNVTAIREQITQTQNEIDEAVQKAADALKAEEQLRQEEDNAIRAKLVATGTGGVHISAIGAAWLFVGVILSTASVEIAKYLK